MKRIAITPDEEPAVQALLQKLRSDKAQVQAWNSAIVACQATLAEFDDKLGVGNTLTLHNAFEKLRK